MKKNKYYCLIAGLPDLYFHEFPSVPDSQEMRRVLGTQLHPADYSLVKLLFLPSDNTNLLNLIQHITPPVVTEGNYSISYLETFLSSSGELPGYMSAFIQWQKKNYGDLSAVAVRNKLQRMFYEYVLESGNGFIQQWSSFDLNLRNIMTAFNSRRYHYDIENQLIQTTYNNEVSEILYENRLNPVLYQEYMPYAEDIFRIADSSMNMAEKEKAFDRIRWEYVEELTFFHYFTIEKILGYMIRLMILERWQRMDPEAGRELLKELADGLKRNFRFPVEFNTINDKLWEQREK